MQQREDLLVDPTGPASSVSHFLIFESEFLKFAGPILGRWANTLLIFDLAIVFQSTDIVGQPTTCSGFCQIGPEFTYLTSMYLQKTSYVSLGISLRISLRKYQILRKG